MQKLERRDTYTPTDAPQVRSNCDSVIKHDQCGQVLQSSKTLSNNSDVDQRQHTGGPKVKVYVLNKNGKPMMPCKPAKARHLLEQNKAKVVTRKPFTIQLLWGCEHNIRPITLGIDAGYRKVGVSAVSDKMELFSAEVILRTDIPKKLQDRAMYRRTRRNRLWHRQPRFDNRCRPNGWMAPSIRHKLDSHIRLVEAIKKLLPVTKVIVEVANFDTQKMQNPEISGVEYQQGTLQGYEVREYLLEKWSRRCVYCKKSGMLLQVEHIIPKSRDGSDRISNLTLSCHECNRKKGNMTAGEFGYPGIQKQAMESLKATAFMNNVRLRLVNLLNCKHTYGYVTKQKRVEQGLVKSHVNDAFVIAGGASQERCEPFLVKQVRRNNRCLQKNRKGFRPSIRRKRYKLQPNDLIRYDGKQYRVKGIHCYGKYVVLINSLLERIDIIVRGVELICYGKGIQFLPHQNGALEGISLEK